MIRRPRPARIVFDGQSRVAAPAWEGAPLFGFSWARIVVIGRGVAARMVGIPGWSFTQLAENFETRAAPYITPAHIEPSIYVLCGGHSDVSAESDPAETVYSDAGHLAGLARAAGAVYVICTTILPSIALKGDNNVRREAANHLILTDPDGHFDDSVNFEVSGLDDPLGPGYADGVHIAGWPSSYGDRFPQDVGTPRAAEVAAPHIDAAIAAVT